jgi:hypothetical protein
MKKTDQKKDNMQRVSAEYVVSVKIEDLMWTSDETDVNAKIIELGKKQLKKYLNGKMFDPDGKVITEQIKIIAKGL